MSEETTTTAPREDYVLDISTQVAPGKKFKVDGEVYEMKNPDAMSEDEEARMTGKFALHARAARKLDAARNQGDAENAARDLRRSRIDLLVELTSMPKDVASKVPLSKQAEIIGVIQDEMGLEAADAEEE